MISYDLDGPKRFELWDSFDSFCEYYFKVLKPHQRLYHEVIEADVPSKLFFDLEFEVGKHGKDMISSEEFLRLIEEDLTSSCVSLLTELSSSPPSPPLIFDSHREKRLSSHVLFPDVWFVNSDSLKNFIDRLVTMESMKRLTNSILLDRQLYNPRNYRTLRIPYSGKKVGDKVMYPLLPHIKGREREDPKVWLTDFCRGLVQPYLAAGGGGGEEIGRCSSLLPIVSTFLHVKLPPRIVSSSSSSSSLNNNNNKRKKEENDEHNREEKKKPFVLTDEQLYKLESWFKDELGVSYMYNRGEYRWQIRGGLNCIYKLCTHSSNMMILDLITPYEAVIFCFSCKRSWMYPRDMQIIYNCSCV